MYASKDDGITHLNVYSNARTELGKALSNFHHNPLGIYYRTPHGEFKTLEGYYHYLRIIEMMDIKGLAGSIEELCPDIDLLRHAVGHVAIKQGRRIKNGAFGRYRYRPKAPTSHTSVSFITALINKLSTEQLGVGLAQALCDGLSLTHYYYFPLSDTTVHPAGGEWLVSLLSIIGNHIDPSGIDIDWCVVLLDSLAEYNKG